MIVAFVAFFTFKRPLLLLTQLFAVLLRNVKQRKRIHTHHEPHGSRGLGERKLIKANGSLIDRCERVCACPGRMHCVVTGVPSAQKAKLVCEID